MASVNVDEGDAGHVRWFEWSTVLARAFAAPGHLVVLIASLHTSSPRLFSVLGKSQVSQRARMCVSEDGLAGPVVAPQG